MEKVSGEQKVGITITGVKKKEEYICRTNWIFIKTVQNNLYVKVLHTFLNFIILAGKPPQ